MSDQIMSTIEVLTAKVKTKEEEAGKLKKLVNELCSEVGVPLRYPNIVEASGDFSIRRDQYYGQTLTSAARAYLETRRSANLGAASFAEIYGAIRNGGYKFGTKDEENAKTVVRTALRKNSSIFHRLPNGDYGLLSWYETAKNHDRNGGTDVPRKAKTPKRAKERTPTPEKVPKSTPKNSVSHQEIRNAIFKMEGQFGAADVEKAIRVAFPSKTLRSASVAKLIWKLKAKGFIKLVAERKGKVGAMYEKI